MYSFECEVIHINQTRENVPVQGVMEYLYELTKKENVSTIHLFGNKIYLEGMLSENTPLDYGCGKVEVKIN